MGHCIECGKLFEGLGNYCDLHVPGAEGGPDRFRPGVTSFAEQGDGQDSALEGRPDDSTPDQAKAQKISPG